LSSLVLLLYKSCSFVQPQGPKFITVTSIDTLYSKSITLYLDAWKISFSHLTVQEHYFLTFKNCKPFQPSYSKSGSWLTYISQSVILCTRATKAILDHAFIEYRQYFFLQSVPSVCMAITRWKHVNISFQTALGLPIVP